MHGYRTVGDIMVDMNPLTGKLYVEALHMTRVIREAYVLLCGKYPHPQTIVPGGMSTTLSTSTATAVFGQFETLTATVTSSAGTPIGTVTIAARAARDSGPSAPVACTRTPSADQSMASTRVRRRRESPRSRARRFASSS